MMDKDREMERELTEFSQMSNTTSVSSVAVISVNENETSQFSQTLHFPAGVLPTSVNEREISQFPQTLHTKSSVLPEAVSCEKELNEFSQTLQTLKASDGPDSSIVHSAHSFEGKRQADERTQWIINGPEPPTLWCKLKGFVNGSAVSLRNKCQGHGEPPMPKLLKSIFPILLCCANYDLAKFKKDLLAGLTLASICIPQSIGYATLAKLDPEYGLYTSVVPPFLYALLGSSREIAIGPVAVVSLLLSSMIQKLEDPVANPAAYRRLVFTVTFFAGTFQATFGIFRLGFLVDYLSHAAIVGFMAGAAIVIGLQQLKGLLGIAHFTTKTDVISVLRAVLASVQYPWNPRNFILGCSFLSFILITRLLGRKNKKLFWLPAIAPLVSVILSTLFVFLTRADKHGVKIVKHIKEGLNPVSIHQLEFNSPYTADLVKIGLVVAAVALTEAIAVGRSFATIRGYRLDGNKEMVAIGIMNIAGSMTSCYAATGSFSRTAVNFSAGCETVVSNIVMATTVLISLVLMTRLLYYTPIAILASIILSALPGLIDLNEAYRIWKVDKLDFLACAGAFFGVLFASVEIGLLLAVAISFAKIILYAIRPGTEELGRIPGTDMFGDVCQYPMALKTPGVLVFRMKSAFLCFANSNFIKERILELANKELQMNYKNDASRIPQLLVFDMSNLMNIDTSGMASLEELHRKLMSQGIEFAIANPRWEVMHKLRVANFVDKIRGKVFLTVEEAIHACLPTTMA